MRTLFCCSECHNNKPKENIEVMIWNTNEFEPALDVKIYCKECYKSMDGQ